MPNNALAELIARRMLGLPLQGDLNLPSEQEQVGLPPTPVSQLPQTAIPAGTALVQVPQAPTMRQVVGEEESWPSILAKSAASGLSQVATGALGAASGILENLGANTQELQNLANEINQALAPKVGKSRAKSWVAGIIQSTINSLAQYALSRRFGIPLLPMFGVTSGGQKYLQTRQEGYAPSTALKAAVPTGLSEALTEKIPFEAVFKDVGKPIVKRLIKLYGGELLGENINTLTEDIVNRVVLHQPQTLNDYIRDLVDTTVITLGQTSLTGLPGIVAQTQLEKRRKAAIPSTEKVIEEALKATKQAPTPEAASETVLDVLPLVIKSLSASKVEANDYQGWAREAVKAYSKIANAIPDEDLSVKRTLNDTVKAFKLIASGRKLKDEELPILSHASAEVTEWPDDIPGKQALLKAIDTLVKTNEPPKPKTAIPESNLLTLGFKPSEQKKLSAEDKEKILKNKISRKDVILKRDGTVVYKKEKAPTKELIPKQEAIPTKKETPVKKKVPAKKKPVEKPTTGSLDETIQEFKNLGYTIKEITSLKPEDMVKIKEEKIPRDQVEIKEGKLILKPKKEAVPKKKALPEKELIPKEAIPKKSEKELIPKEKKPVQAIDITKIAQTPKSKIKGLVTIDEKAKEIVQIKDNKVIVHPDFFKKRKVTRKKLLKEALTPKPVAKEPIVKKGAAAPATPKFTEQERKSLKKLGYSDKQIQRMKPEAAKELLSKKIKADFVSVKQDGTIKVLKPEEVNEVEAALKKKVKTLTKKPKPLSLIELPKMKKGAESPELAAKVYKVHYDGQWPEGPMMGKLSGAYSFTLTEKTHPIFGKKGGATSIVVPRGELSKLPEIIEQKIREYAEAEGLAQPELIPGHPVKSESRNLEATSRNKMRLFKTNLKALKKAIPHPTIEDRITAAYYRFKPAWEKFTGKGKYLIPNLGRTKYVQEEAKARKVEDKDLFKLDYLLSAKEWLAGTNFKEQIKKGLITEKEAQARIRFFDKFGENVFRFKSELTSGLTDMFRKWAEGEPYKLDPEEPDSPHINNIIMEALGTPKEKIAPRYTLEELLHPPKDKAEEISHHLAYGFAYTIMDRYIRLARNIPVSTVEDILDNMLTYGLVHYEMAFEDEDSFFFNELAPTELSDEQIKQLLKNATFDKIADYLENFHFFFLKNNMGLHKLDTILGLSAGLMKYTMDLIRSEEYFESTDAGRVVRNEVKNVVMPAIQRIIQAADKLMVVSRDLKHIVGIKGIMKKLERTILAYQNKEIDDPEKYIRTLEPYWRKVILPYLTSNEKALAEKIGSEEFYKAKKAGIADKILNNLADRMTAYSTSANGFKSLVTQPNTNAYQALLYLSKHAQSLHVRQMASILAELGYVAKALPDVPLEIRRVASSSRAVFNSRGPHVGTITVRPNLSPYELEVSFLHEVTHALTYYRLSVNKEALQTVNNLMVKAREHISDTEKKVADLLLRQVRLKEAVDWDEINELTKDDESFKAHYKEYGDKWYLVLYGLAHPHEFVANAISDPATYLFLNGIEVEKKQSLWDKVIDFVVNVLGIGKDKATLWTESVKEILDIINKSKLDDVVFLKQLRREPQISNYLKQQLEATELADPVLKDFQVQQFEEKLQQFAPSLNDYDYEHLKGFAKQLLKQSPKAAPKLADIGKVRQAVGLPLWTSLIHPEFAPLFKHTVKAMEEKNFALHNILETGNIYFSQLNDEEKEVVNAAIKISDALNIQFTRKELANFPNTVKSLKALFNKLFIYRKAPSVVRQQILEQSPFDLPKEYSQPEYIKRFKYFFDYALPSFKIQKIYGVMADGYYNYCEVTNKTAEHISDKLLTLIIDVVVKDPMASNTIFALIKHPELKKKISEDALATYEPILEEVENHPLFKKYERIRDLIDKLDFYSPRYRDQDASEMIVAFDKEAFAKSFKKHIAQTGSRAKALEKVYDDLSQQNKVYLREHVRRIDPDMQKKLERAKRVFGKDNVVLLLPNYRLAESVYGDITEGNVGAFLEALANKTKSGKASPETLDEILSEISNMIEEELLARSRAGQKFLHRNPYLILGYHLDKTTEETFNYVNNAANYMARIEALVNGLPLLNRIDPKQQAKLRDYAHKWFFDQLKPQTQFDKVVGKTKAYMFLWYLSGMLRPAAVQATQMFVSTIPLAKIIYKLPLSKVSALFMKAYKDVILNGNIEENENLTEDEKKFLNITYAKGVTTAQFINQIRDEVAGSGGWTVKAATWLATPFAYMEQTNRLATALGVYRFFKQHNPSLKPDDPTVVNEATDLINMTHFLMGKLNLPSIATGGTVPQGLARLAVTFRSFTMNLLELYNYTLRHMPASKKLWGLNKEGLEFVAYSLLAFSMFGGILSIPFLDDLIKLLERQTGKPLRRLFFKKIGDINNPLAYSLERGLPSLIGVDLSGSLKIEIPTSPSDVLNAIFGVYGGLAKNATDSLVAYQGFDKINAVYRILPQFIGNPLKAYEAYKGLKNPYNKPIYDENGKPIKVSLPEALLIATGFRPTRFGKTYAYKSAARNISAYFRKRRNEIYNMFRSAQTPKQRAKVLAEIVKYNKEASKYITVPRITLRSLATAIMPKQEKLAEELRMRGL